MFKKLVIIVSLLIAAAMGIVLSSIAVINKVGEADELQVRAFTVLSRTEEIHSHINKLNRVISTASEDDAAAAWRDFRREYGATQDHVYQLVAPLHKGDCAACHAQLLDLDRKLTVVKTELVKADAGRLAGSGRGIEHDRTINVTLAEMLASSAEVTRLARKERRFARRDAKAVEEHRDAGMAAVMKERLARSDALVARAERIEYSLHALADGIASRDAHHTQNMLVAVSHLLQPKPVQPSLDQRCYGCHYEIAEIPHYAEAVSATAARLHASGQTGSPNPRSIKDFRAAVDAFERHIEHIQVRAQASQERSMAQVEEARQRLRVFAIGVGFIVIIGSIAAALTITHWVRKRLQAIYAGIEAVADGDYTHVIDASARDEIADLAHAFNLMVNRVRSSQEMLEQLNDELSEMHLSAVKAFIQAIEAKDPYTRGHSENVARYALILGERIKLRPGELEQLYTAALLHDIGKIGIREDILNKASKLTTDEYEHIKTHPRVSAQIIGKIPNLAPIARAIFHHHESFDGSGYPDGLAGQHIPLESRILAIADAFDAMTSTRPYRDGCSKNEALEELERKAGSQFDPQLVKAFMEAMQDADSSHKGDEQSIA